MAVDYSTLKKGGFMRQKQKNNTVEHDRRRAQVSAPPFCTPKTTRWASGSKEASADGEK